MSMAAAVKLSPSAVMPTTSNMGMSYALVLYVQSSNRTSQYWCSSLMVALVLMKKCVRAWSEPSLYWQYAFSSGRFSSANMAWADVRSSMNSRRCRLTALLTSCSVMRLSGRSCFRARRMPPGVRPLERSDATWSYTSGKSRRSDGCALRSHAHAASMVVHSVSTGADSRPLPVEAEAAKNLDGTAAHAR